MYGDLTTIREYYLDLPVRGEVNNVQIHTWSSTLAVPLKPCPNCPPHDRLFDLTKAESSANMLKCASDTCRPNTCHAYRRHRQCRSCSSGTHPSCGSVDKYMCGFFLQYAHGSGAVSALVEADVTLAGLTAPLVFGSILRVSKGFESVAVDGILGLAFSTLPCNPTCVTPFFDVLVKSGQVERDIFSLCTGRHGGVLSLGGSIPDLYDGKLQYLPLSKKKVMHFYDVDIAGAEVGRKSVAVPDFSDRIVDSGMTALVVAPRVYRALQKYFQNHFCDVPGLCPKPTQNIRGHASARLVHIIHVSAENAALVWNQHVENATRSANLKTHERASEKDDDEDNLSHDGGLTWFFHLDIVRS